MHQLFLYDSGSKSTAPSLHRATASDGGNLSSYGIPQRFSHGSGRGTGQAARPELQPRPDLFNSFLRSNYRVDLEIHNVAPPGHPLIEQRAVMGLH